MKAISVVVALVFSPTLLLQSHLRGRDAGGRSFASQWGKVMRAEIPERARKLILGEALRRMSTPILIAKGYPV